MLIHEIMMEFVKEILMIKSWGNYVFFIKFMWNSIMNVMDTPSIVSLTYLDVISLFEASRM